MPFDINSDFSIFDDLIKKRPEIVVEKFKEDLTSYYLPYIQKLIDLKKNKSVDEGLIVGVSAVQGVGKTTQGEVLEILLEHFGFSSDSRSIDDHYITHRELSELRDRDPRFIRRGVTHDIALAILDLRDLQKMTDNSSIIVSGYDKGVHLGDGDRFRWINMESGLTIQAEVVKEELVVNKEMALVSALKLISAEFKGQEIPVPERMGSDIPIQEHFLPEQLINFLQNQTKITITDSGETAKFLGYGEIEVSKKDLPNSWRVVSKKPDFIFYDGWMLGARRVEDESIFESGLPALETKDAQEFAKYVNKKLDNYRQLWMMIEFLNVLYIPNYQLSIKWRDQAEEALRAKGEGMTSEQITEFVHYFWRSVHPAIHIKNLAHDSEHTNQVVMINDDHTIGQVLAPPDVD